ncbi:DNA replication ATP-dependent helicase/nuclease [Venturia inaequalis]|nr:DNA replication ATP-dependent helicase/nuclease [Venturia inaequalis]
MEMLDWPKGLGFSIADDESAHEDKHVNGMGYAGGIACADIPGSASILHLQTSARTGDLPDATQGDTFEVILA